MLRLMPIPIPSPPAHRTMGASWELRGFDAILWEKKARAGTGKGKELEEWREGREMKGEQGEKLEKGEKAAGNGGCI